MCLVSPYWEDFANKLITLTKELGVTYFNWDAVGQYGCNNPNHYHGNSKNSATDRAQRYSFLQPEYMVKIVNKVCKVARQSIFDFDISEDGRCVGLQYLSAGKYLLSTTGHITTTSTLPPHGKVCNQTKIQIFLLSLALQEDGLYALCWIITADFTESSAKIILFGTQK